MKRMIRTLFLVAAAAVTVAAAGATPADAMGNTKWSDIELASGAPTTGAWVPKIELGTF